MKGSDQGLMLATLILVPVMVICCVGGTLLFGAAAGGFAGWLTGGLFGAGAVTTGLTVAAVSVFFLMVRRHRRSNHPPLETSENNPE